MLEFKLRVCGHCTKNFRMDDSVVLFESSESLSLCSKKTDDFYNQARLEIAGILNELDEKWANVKDVEPQKEYRHIFKLKPFEEFLTEEMKRRVPNNSNSQPAQPKASAKPQSIMTISDNKFPKAPPVRRRVEIKTVKASVVSVAAPNAENRKQIASITSRTQPKPPGWIRVEDIHVPL